jgi:carbonic anhydrase
MNQAQNKKNTHRLLREKRIKTSGTCSESRNLVNEPAQAEAAQQSKYKPLFTSRNIGNTVPCDTISLAQTPSLKLK